MRKIMLKIFLVGLASAFVYIVWHILSLVYVRLHRASFDYAYDFTPFLGLGLILTLLFYVAIFFAIGCFFIELQKI